MNFYTQEINTPNGETIKMNDFKGKVVLVVNTATQCGLTPQFDGLEKLHQTYKDQGLVVLGAPCNQFGGQEPGTETEIKNFCETNFNITFPMTSKYDVKGDNCQQIYIWAKDTFGKSTIPKWNFHKILINKNGKIEDTFASFTGPLSNKIINKLNQIL